MFTAAETQVRDGARVLRQFPELPERGQGKGPYNLIVAAREQQRLGVLDVTIRRDAPDTALVRRERELELVIIIVKGPAVQAALVGARSPVHSTH